MTESWPNITPRAWQRDALPLALDAIRSKRPAIVSAIMGSGKSVLIAEICGSGRGRVVVTVPTVQLVDQMHATISARCESVGRYYTHAKDTCERITIVCLPSLAQYIAAVPEPPALWIADEAHRTEAETVLRAYTEMKPHAAIGFTATPFRSSADERLSLWHSLAYEYGFTKALRDGVVVKPVLRLWDGKTTNQDDVCVAMIKRWADGPGLTNARDISDAEVFAARLCSEGIPAAAIHSKHARALQAELIEQLRTGRLAVLVHVSMLQEGVDLPWLQWLCMRRPVRSKVRFCQEVGRVLRAHPGKASAQLLDPHDLFDTFGLSYEAILACDVDDSISLEEQAARALLRMLEKREKIEEEEEEDVAEFFYRGATVNRARALPPMRRYVRQLYMAFVGAGVVETKITSTGWRGKTPSEKQLKYVASSIAGLARDTTIPIAHRKALGLVGECAADLRRGDVSDLMSVGFCLRDRRRMRKPWPLDTATTTRSNQ
jgi:superfamily II DNA or RNA helicase